MKHQRRTVAYQAWQYLIEQEVPHVGWIRVGEAMTFNGSQGGPNQKIGQSEDANADGIASPPLQDAASVVGPRLEVDDLPTPLWRIEAHHQDRDPGCW